eukprot:CAMPEP_0183484792 /NCGR_PEP_ID=MMETSP0370-20130417/179101_1 /TAXON_ID=268820 /ORGANISM="Peridinium aciculiferum, Strain PAER-2" /LENGTH=210 /DNA_ID=CAMNT_0025678085 /DNA_START=21 /DNA_END=654 /DNA_ORIENTATION=+
MALLRSAARCKHYWSAGDKQYIGCWEAVPKKMGTALGPVSYAARTPVPKDYILRGTGVHGPENGEVMKLVLWNRLKQRRPQRTGCDLAELQEFYRMEVAIVWWMFGLCFMMAPLNWHRRARPRERRGDEACAVEQAEAEAPPAHGLDLAELQEFYRMEVAIVWWMFGLCFMMAPLNWWGKKYRMVHDHYPWAPKRHDGTKGVGPYCWFLE